MTRTSLACALLATLLAAPLARGGIGDNSVGMNVHDGRATFVDACVDLGVGWVRMDANWFQLEPNSDDNYQWEPLSTAVADAVASGLKVYLTLGYTPQWVPRHGDTDGQFHNDVPDNSTAWSDFVSDAVAHFRPLGVTHYGIWNEPNLGGFFEGTVAEYANTILAPGAAAVRAACASLGADCKVLGPDVANVGECDVYLEDLFALVPASTFDIIAHHIYQDFAETGWQIWDGDSFMSALDDQRFSFTRKDLRAILDEAGYTGEVWITETGYRATPIGDAGEEDLQAVYVRRVLEEQLARAWYTNSFFYEIMDCGPDQPTCDIDGFGLMRAVSGSPGSRSFPSDFRLKPAFLALRGFIDDHPEIVGTEPPPQCGDGTDNDGDGRTDLADRGCTDPLDDDESDDPPRPSLDVYRTPGLALDGSSADMGPDGWLLLGPEVWRGTEPLSGAADLSLRLAVRWDAAGLYLAVEVTDDVHDNDQSADLLWLGDSLQLAFDIGAEGGSGYDGVNDHEFAFGLSGADSLWYRHAGPAGASNDVSTLVTRSGSTTLYEVRLAPSALPGLSLQAGAIVRASFLVNESDGASRLGWIEWTPGIGVSKEPELYGEFHLLAETSGGPEPDGGSDGGADAGQEDGGIDAGADSGADPGLDAGDPGPADAGLDAGADAGADEGGEDGGADGGDSGGEDSGGCGCASAPASAAALSLLGLLLAVRRRRRG